MKIHFFTIALDAMPWLGYHLPVFNTLPMDWDWSIVEGVGEPVKDTAWCKQVPGRLSVDGTTQYMQQLSDFPRVHVVSREMWSGKTEMVNTALLPFKEPGLLWQIDSDEIWTRDQIVKVAQLFTQFPMRNCARFWCRYFFGPRLCVITRNCYTQNPEKEWRRVWRFEPGMKFKSHEPPILEHFEECSFTNDETEAAGLVFDHYAYVFESQVEFKEEYYGYVGAIKGWRRLQANTKWPARLADFLPWVKDQTMVAPI